MSVAPSTAVKARDRVDRAPQVLLPLVRVRSPLLPRPAGHLRKGGAAA